MVTLLVHYNFLKLILELKMFLFCYAIKTIPYIAPYFFTNPSNILVIKKIKERIMINSCTGKKNQVHSNHRLRSSIDKISFNIPKRFIRINYYKSNIENVTITKNGKYYYKIHIHAEFLKSNESIILQILKAFIRLYKKGIIFLYNTSDFAGLIFNLITLSELEIAFDMPKSRFDWTIIEQYFKLIQNTYYTKDYINRIKKSRISIYNRDLKLNNEVVNRTPTYRLEFRLMPRDLIQMCTSNKRKLDKFPFLYQEPNDLLKKMEEPLRNIRLNLGIPREIIKTYRDLPLLDRIFS